MESYPNSSYSLHLCFLKVCLSRRSNWWRILSLLLCKFSSYKEMPSDVFSLEVIYNCIVKPRSPKSQNETGWHYQVLANPRYLCVGVCNGASVTSQHRLAVNIHSFEPGDALYTQEKGSLCQLKDMCQNALGSFIDNSTLCDQHTSSPLCDCSSL